MGHAQDEGLYRRFRKVIRGSSYTLEGLQHLPRPVRDAPGANRECLGVHDEPPQERRTLPLAHIQQIFARSGGHQLRYGVHYPGALLTNVQLREVEAEDLRLADKVAEATFDDSLVSLLQEAAANEEEILHKRSEEHTSELQSRQYLVCRLLLEK